MGDPSPPDLQKEVLDEKRFVTGRLSETTRYIGFGLLATFYGIASSPESFARTLFAEHSIALKLMAVCGFLSVLLDYLQYVCGRAAVQSALKRTDKPFTYNDRWFSMRARALCFQAKQIAAILGSLLFILIVLTAI